MRENWKNNLSDFLFGRPTGSGRQIYLDILRVIATAFVIAVHTVSLAASLVSPEQTSYFVLEIFYYVFISCNLLFVMISGALLLPVKGEHCGAFFAKRFTRVAVPLVVYYIFYVAAKEGTMWLKPAYWRVLFQRMVLGPPEAAPHFWLVYTLLGLYLLTPFLRWLLQHIPDEVLCGLIFVIFIANALDTYGPILGMDAQLGVIVDSYAGVFILGYFLATKCSRRAENFFIAGGLISFAVSCFFILSAKDYPNYIYQNAPTMLFFTATIFLLVKRSCLVLEKENFIIRLICKYSFSILLIHWGVLHFVVKQVLCVDVLGGHIWGGCLMMMVLTLALSVAGAIVVDNTLLRFLYALLQLPGKIFYQLKPRKSSDTVSIMKSQK